ncbi:pesticidal protein Cry7Aa [Candidatus Giovannonibacteria bacterium]|nr:pesticidal protein Cry7Aa [Candidatus Giovannonibacteria bacterium]
MFEVKKLGVILSPTKNDFESRAVLNPGVYQEGETVHLFYRATDRKHISTIGYAKLEGPTNVVERKIEPVIVPEEDYERMGTEDPRITKIDDTFYMTYVAHDGKNAVTAYASGKDLFKLKKHGVITPDISYDEAASLFRDEKLKDRYFMFESYYEEGAGKDVLLWDKDVFFFPRKIKGQYALLQRILPDIQIAYFKSFKSLQKRSFWEKYLSDLDSKVVLENKFWFESRNIGGGAPPIETDDGWLLIYHAVEELNKQRVYHAGAALMDINDPTKLIGRLDHPLFSPKEEWEVSGEVGHVVFPTGTAIFGEDLYIYYGAADEHIAVAQVRLKDLLSELKNPKNNQ